jgi:hypothetical protein
MPKPANLSATGLRRRHVLTRDCTCQAAGAARSWSPPDCHPPTTSVKSDSCSASPKMLLLMDVPVQFFQSVIAIELAVTGALLWQMPSPFSV